MITGNVVARVSHGPAMLIQRLKEELAIVKARGEGTATVLAAALDKLDQASLTLEAFRLKEEAIQADGNLSDQGKRTKMEQIAQEFSGQLAFIERAATDRREAARQLRQELDKLPTVVTDPVLSYLREAEVRRRLERVALADRLKLLGDATKPQKTMILLSVENDPLNPDDLMPAEYRQRVKDELLETSRAEDLERWRTLNVCSEKLTLLANVLETTMGKYSVAVPSFPGQLISKTDLKQVNTQSPPDKKKSIDVPPKQSPVFV